MRPVKLRIKGMRSYHAERVVPFEGIDLLAIIGDTGAGKSSLLEALVFALYSASTWDQRNVKELISDRCATMTVSFDFRAGGELWQVTRSISRTSSPPSSHELICLSDPDRPRADGKPDVNARVEQLVGLKHKAFCSAVLLPQGKFERLLKATSTERVDVLKNVLGLEQLAELREPALELAVALEGKRQLAFERRSCFSADPAAELARADSTIAELEPKAQALSDAAARMAERHTAAEQQKARVGALQAQAEALKARLTGQCDELAELAEQERRLAERRDPIVAELEAVHVELGVAERDAEQAAQDGRTHADATVAHAAVAGAARTLRALVEADEAWKGACDTLDSDVAKHHESDRQLETAKAEGRAARERADASQVAAEQAAGLAQAGQSALGELREAQQAHAQAAEQATAAHAAVKQLAAERDRLLAGAQQAAGRRSDAEQAVKQLRHRSQAATLAAGCEPGMPCPVCERSLPASFSAPHVDGLAEAERQLELAAEAERTAARAADEKAGELRQARTAAELADQGLPALIGACDQRTAAARTALSLAAGADEDALQGAADRLAAGAAEAQVRAEQDATHVQALLSAFQERSAQHGAQGAALEQRRRGVDAERVRIDAEREAALTALGQTRSPVALPAQIDAVQLELVAGELAELAEQARRSELQLDQLRGRERQLREQVRKIDAERQAQITTPTVQIRTTLTALRDELLRLTDAGPDAAPALDAPLSVTAAWAEQVEHATRTEVQAQLDGVQRARDRAAADEQAIVAVLGELGFEDRAAFDRHHRDMDAQLLAARREHARAGAQVEPVGRLDLLIAQLGALAEGLRGVGALLAGSRFIRFAVERRQRDLLIHSSQTLEEVTGGRFAFAENFNIVDNETGQARSPETLSGGETFLASLALALGLVEMTARGGARLEALFLDEGFGSLDPNTLDGALDALERRAKAGRLIALISHVPAVAERIENVLKVSRTPDGSDAALLDMQQRSDLVASDALARLSE